jgi:hypothetical protein
LLRRAYRLAANGREAAFVRHGMVGYCPELNRIRSLAVDRPTSLYKGSFLVIQLSAPHKILNAQMKNIIWINWVNVLIAFIIRSW